MPYFFKKLLPLIGLLLPVNINAERVNVSKAHINLPSAQLNVYFDSPFSEKNKEKLMQWLRISSEAITTLYGRFPVEQVDVHLYHTDKGNEPVPWGEVWKNGQYRVNFQVNPTFSLDHFVTDWTASHEFSHLLHPYPESGNAWFGEGLASYYQNILRVRHHSLSEAQAWQKLLEGFQRGEAQAKYNKVTLLQASRNMHSNGNYQHVYWGGAAYFLIVDIRLRRETKGKESLDTAWYKFRQCCLSAYKTWSAEKLIEKLDQLTGTSVFSEEYSKHLHSRIFPDYRRSFKQLNIEIIKEKVQLMNDNSFESRLRNRLVTANQIK